jgi:hypothetical protein
MFGQQSRAKEKNLAKRDKKNAAARPRRMRSSTAEVV